ncbi:MAG TPA: cytochrome c maturation protein CcmE [Actinomycetota bacterium]|nr:cytochrome c maturation protein CcmE [Actinomycetota bacterium]
MESPTAGSPKRRAKFAIGGGIIVLSLLGLVAWAMNRTGATSFYYTTSELQGAALAAGAEEYRVNGNVIPDSVVQEGLRTTFDITDGTTAVTIVTDETLPDAFWSAMAAGSNEVEVVAEGRYDGSRFTASQVFAKCPSKFKAKA